MMFTLRGTDWGYTLTSCTLRLRGMHQVGHNETIRSTGTALGEAVGFFFHILLPHRVSVGRLDIDHFLSPVCADTTQDLLLSTAQISEGMGKIVDLFNAQAI